MLPSSPFPDPVFTAFEDSIDEAMLPKGFNSPFACEPHPLCLKAVARLQQHLTLQQEWKHNFGLVPGAGGTIIGKMFGVLVVKTQAGTLGYLAAFSGKLADSNHHAGFVPPVFDSLNPDSFLNTGMLELGRINAKIKMLDTSQPQAREQVQLLKIARKEHSNALQQKLYAAYAFLNQAGVSKSLRELFDAAAYKNPPAGAGECAAPKLLQYAFRHKMQPIAIAEFWWGLSPKSAFWKHGHFYPACEEKCRPILRHMLEGLEMEEA